MDFGSLLGSLLGLQHSPAATAPDATVAPPATVAAPAPVNPQPIPVSPLPAQPAPVANNQDVEVMGDRWKPRERKPLETIADLLIGAPIFTKHIKAENEASAMQGFDENPIRSIRRLAKVDPKAAWAMFNQYHDNQIQDQIQKRADDDQTLGRGIALLGVATPQNYSAVKQRVEEYFANKKFDPGMKLPDTYDADAIEGFREGALKGKEQLDYESQNNYRQERLKQFDRQIMSNDSYRNARLGQFDRTISNTERYRQQRLGQLGQNVSEHERHDRAIEGHAMPTPGTRELSPDRTVMREFRSDGQWHIFKKVNGQIKQVGILAPQKQGGRSTTPMIMQTLLTMRLNSG
jgi:hypothetical protein